MNVQNFNERIEKLTKLFYHRIVPIIAFAWQCLALFISPFENFGMGRWKTLILFIFYEKNIFSYLVVTWNPIDEMIRCDVCRIKNA